MKLKQLLFAALAMTAMTASAQDATYELRTLTFEGENWSNLIDDVQYGGSLLYGDYSECGYHWEDSNNTLLSHDVVWNWGSQVYWNGGHAVSNYWDGDLSNGDYNHQLSLYTPDTTENGQGGKGHNGSDNYCIHNGSNIDLENYAETLPTLYFSDYKARVIDHMYVNNTTYTVNVIKNGNTYASALGSEGYLKIIATGYDADLGKTGSAEFYLAQNGEVVSEWTKWDLSSLGAVAMVQFNITGSDSGDYGLNTPAYFAYDDVAVRFENGSQSTVETINADVKENVYYNLQGIRVNAPVKGNIYVVNGKKIKF
jgi:hypothetical protein